MPGEFIARNGVISRGNVIVTGSLSTSGSFTTTGTITAQTLVVQTITSSISSITGSTNFGSLLANTHTFTGSLNVTGGLAVTTTGVEFQVNPTGVNLGNALTDSHVISGSLRINSSTLIVSSSGNIGIGTTTPNANLHIQSSASSGQNLRIQTSIAAGRNYVQWANGSGDMGYIGYGGADGKFWINNQLADDMLFHNNGAERMRITSGGELLINATTNGAPNLGYQLGVRGTNANSLISIALANQTLSTQGAYLGLDGAVGYIHMIDNKPWIFSTNNTERMRITSGGNTEVRSGNVLNVYRTDNTRALQLYTTANECVIDSWEASSEPLMIRSNGTGGRIVFHTNAAERMRVTNDGRVSIGTSSPTATTLYINATNNNGNAFRAGNFFAGAQSSGTDYPAIGYNMRFTSTSTIQYEANDYVSYIYFGIGRVDTYTAGAGSAGATVSATRGPFVNNGGTTWTNGSSDQRLKKNFETTQGLAEVLQIEPVKYHFNWEEDTATKRLGFKAQNLQPLIPEMVQPNGDKFEDGSDILTLTPDYLIPVLVKAIQELTSRVQELENK